MRGCVIPPPLEHLTEFITRKAWKTRRSSTFHKNTVWKFTSITNGRTNQLLDQKYDGPDSVGSYLPHILRKLHISSVFQKVAVARTPSPASDRVQGSKKNLGFDKIISFFCLRQLYQGHQRHETKQFNITTVLQFYIGKIKHI